MASVKSTFAHVFIRGHPLIGFTNISSCVHAHAKRVHVTSVKSVHY